VSKKAKIGHFSVDKGSMSGRECVSFKVMLVEDDEGFRRSLSGLRKSRFPSILLVEASDDAEAMEKKALMRP